MERCTIFYIPPSIFLNLLIDTCRCVNLLCSELKSLGYLLIMIFASHGQRSLVGYYNQRVSKSQIRLSDFTFTFTLGLAQNLHFLNLLHGRGACECLHASEKKEKSPTLCRGSNNRHMSS